MPADVIIQGVVAVLVAVLGADRGMQALRERRNGNERITRAHWEQVDSKLDTMQLRLDAVLQQVNHSQRQIERHLGYHEGTRQ